jgi:predicted transcriptional regulator
MTSAATSTKLRKLIAAEMKAGEYKSQDALLIEALRALADRRAAIAGVRRGLEDAKAGRYRSRKEFHRQMVKRHPFLADS